MAGNAFRFRIASWNVLYGEMGTAEQIGEMFKAHELDVVCFCEVPGGDWTGRVGGAAGMHHWVLSEISSAMHTDKYKSILSRTPLTHPREIEPHGFGWWPCTLMGADAAVNGVDIAIYSLHVPGSAHDGPDADARPAAESRSGCIAREVVPRETGRELLMMGDYNDRIDEPNLDCLEGAGMRATWRDLDIDLAGKFSWSERGQGIEHSGVIDHIMYRTGSGIRAVDGGIIELDPPLSDHKPVWAEFLIPAAE